MATHLVLFTILCYGASLAGYIAFLATARRFFGQLGTLMLVAGLAFHYLALIERSRLAHTVPYNDLYGSLSLFGWLLAVTYLGLELFHRDRSVGAFILPFVIAVFALAQGTGAVAPTPPPAQGPLLALHITLNVLGYAAFALSFVLSAIYLVQNSLLRSHRLGKIVWRFPALESLERMSRSSVIVGLVSLVGGRHRLRITVGQSHLWPLLERRSQGDHHRGDPGGVRRLPMAGADGVLARRASLGVVRSQFFVRAVQL